MEMLSVRRSEVPAYLHSSLFYKSLSEDDDGEITVLNAHMKAEPTVVTAADLVHLLSTIRFWGLQSMPDEALYFAMCVADEDDFSQIEEFEDISGTVRSLKAINSEEGEKKLHKAGEYGRIDFIRSLTKQNYVLDSNTGVHAATHGYFACLEYVTSVLKEFEDKPYKNVILHKLTGNVSYESFLHLHANGASLAGCSIRTAAESGNLSCLRYFHEHMGVALHSDHAAATAARGDLACLKYLCEHGCPITDMVSTLAAEKGHVECLKYAHAQGCVMSKLNLMYTKNLDCIKYMREQGVKWDCNIYHSALRENRLDCLQYFHDQGLEYKSTPATCGAPCTKSGASLRFLYEHGAPVTEYFVNREVLYYDALACLQISIEFGYPLTTSLFAEAASRGAMRCLQYLRETNCPWDASACTNAASQGRIPALQYLLDSGCPLDADTFAAAASAAYNDVCLVGSLQLLQKAGCPWDARATAAAANTRHDDETSLNALRYLHESGCPWDERTTAKAAQRGNVDTLRYAVERGCPLQADLITHVLEKSYDNIFSVVKYLHEQGCLWGSQVCTFAAGRGHLDVLKYAHEHGCEWNAETCVSAAAAKPFYHLPDQSLICLKYLHQNGCAWNVSACNAAAENGRLEALTYLHQHGCPCDATTTASAARFYKSGCLQYLHENGCPWDESTCTAAVNAGSLACLKYAHEHGCPWSHRAYKAAHLLVHYEKQALLQYLDLHGCPRTADETAAAASSTATQRKPASSNKVMRMDAGSDSSPPAKKQKQDRYYRRKG